MTLPLAFALALGALALVLGVPATARLDRAAATTTCAQHAADDGTCPSEQSSSGITRTEAMSRASSWISEEVPYSQSDWWTDLNGTYRQDCSGFVAMAWHLDEDTTYWTGNLATVSHRISSWELKPGDILLLPGDHVVIFAAWADLSQTQFELVAQFRPGHYAGRRTDSLRSYLDRGFEPFRYDRMMENHPLQLSGAHDEGHDAVNLVGGESVGVESGAQIPPSVDRNALPTTAADPASTSSATWLLPLGLALVFVAFPMGVGVRAARGGPTGPNRRSKECHREISDDQSRVAPPEGPVQLELTFA